MKSLLRLIEEMENQFTVNDRDDLVFKSKLKELASNKDLVMNIEKDQNFKVEYEDLSEYWYAVGKFNITVKNKEYEIILKYTYPQDGELHDGNGEIPDVPVILVERKEILGVA